MLNKTRIIQAIFFEVGALSLFVLIFAPLMNKSVTELGVLGVALSLVTVVLLYFYNILFDKILSRRTGSSEKKGSVRVLHALIFESLLIGISLPAVAWWLKIGFVAALGIEAAAVTFMVIYTYIFHLVVEKFISASNH